MGRLSVEEEYEPVVSTTRIWVKVIFLVLVIGGGMIMVAVTSGKNKEKAQKPSVSASKEVASESEISGDTYEVLYDKGASEENTDSSEIVVVDQSQIEENPKDTSVIEENGIGGVSEVDPTKKPTLNDAKEKTTEIANDTVAKVQESVGSVLGEVAANATDAIKSKAEEVASESAQLVVDYAYKTTIFEAIVKMIDSMPERQKSEFEKMYCSQ